MKKRGRVFDPGTGRWYKDGFAPFQLPEVIEADCLRCGGIGTLSIRASGATCSVCSLERPKTND